MMAQNPQAQQPVVTGQGGLLNQIDFTETIKNDETRLNNLQDKHVNLLHEIQDIVNDGYVDDDGILHDGLDKAMWNQIRKRVFGELPFIVSIYMGIMGEKVDINVLPNIFPILERVVTVRPGNKEEVTRDVRQYKSIQPPQEGEEVKEKRPVRKEEGQTEPIQLIQTQGQPLPNTDALTFGSKNHNIQWGRRYLFWCRGQWRLYYRQCQNGGDYTKREMLERISDELYEYIDFAESICFSAFEVIRSQYRQLIVTLAKAQMQQQLPYFPEERQRREMAWGYTMDKQTITNMLDYARRLDKAQKERESMEQGGRLEPEVVEEAVNE